MSQSAPLVLVVEDQLILALHMQWALETAGMRAAITASPEETRARIGREMPAVAVVDLNLRGHLDGLELASELIAGGVNVVIASAYAREELGRSVPAAAYLRKPVASEDLVAAVRAALPAAAS